MKIRFAGLALGLAMAMGANGQMGMMGPQGMMGGSTVRHRFVMRHGLPPAYAHRVNPLRADAENVAAGGALYGRYCAACHGPAGRGDGQAGKTLDPPPADLAAALRTPLANDGFLYWTIAEGGAALHTAMPAFKAVLKPDEIWRIVLYLRRL